MCSASELWNSLPCVLPVPSGSICKLSLTFYMYAPHCQVPPIPNPPTDERYSQRPTRCKARQIHQWPQRHLLSLRASHNRGHVHRTLNTSLPPFTQVIPFWFYIFKDLNSGSFFDLPGNFKRPGRNCWDAEFTLVPETSWINSASYVFWQSSFLIALIKPF